MGKKRTPAQQQRYDLKQKHPDCLLLFRLGDFYELFHDDAKIGHKVLALTLTAKNKRSDNPIPMAGIPHHALDKYLPKLVEAGYKIAIAEQVGEVTQGSVVEREIVDIITPGTYIEENADTNSIAACRFGGDENRQYHLAWGDYSLGLFRTKSFKSLEKLFGQLETTLPKELVVHQDFPERNSIEKRAEQREVIFSIHDHPHAINEHLTGILDSQTLDGFGSALKGGRKHALSTLFSYIQQYQKDEKLVVYSINDESPQEHVQLDPVTVKNLEIFRSSYEGTEKHALFGVINDCKTALGKRLLKEWLLYPLRDRQEIIRRYGLVEKFYANENRDFLSSHCRDIIDIPRVMSRIFYKSPSPYVVQSLATTLSHIFSSEGFVEALKQVGLKDSQVEDLVGLKNTLEEAIYEQIESDTHGFIADGWDDEVDKLRQVSTSADKQLKDYYRLLQESVGANSIKIHYTQNQGYTISVTNKDSDLLKDALDADNEKFDFVRVKSLKSSQRYMSTYLENLQAEITEAKEALHEEEYRVLKEIIARIDNHAQNIETLSHSIAQLDIILMISYRLDEGWVIPECISKGDNESRDTDKTGLNSKRIAIKAGKHPVVEEFLPAKEQFIPNDYRSSSDNFFQLITGPNMGGKSTYLRQNALILLLAHAGLPVPAERVKYYILDGIYARVGSGDALAKNQSTFMTEMIEMAYIVRNATNESFIVLDELGRGTSTYDGMALAKSISVYMCQNIQAATLFATHYHELTELEGQVEGFINKSVSVYESSNDVVFLKKIVEGGANKSYGIDVAKLAGMPDEILQSARAYLESFIDNKYGGDQQAINNKTTSKKPSQPGLSLGEIDDEYKEFYDKVDNLLKDVDKDELTPLEGLVLLHKILGLLGE